MNILIVSYFYSPENTPRAFRAYELTQELQRQGHRVKVISVRNECLSLDADILVEPGFLLNKRKSFNPSNIKQCQNSFWFSFRNKVIKLYNRFFGGRTIEATLPIYKAIKDISKNGEIFDKVISIGLPFCSHLAVGLAKKNGLLPLSNITFDYGDPYYRNSHMKLFYSAKVLESFALKYTDRVLVPVEKARDAFVGYKNLTIDCIPQGFNFDLSLNNPRNLDFKHVSFFYAGNFYKSIRNPLPFFSFLKDNSKVFSSFKIILYMDLSQQFNLEVVEFLEKNKFIFEVNNIIDRDLLLSYMNSNNFIGLNFLNADSYSQPSKVIDYAICRMPFIDIEPDFDINYMTNQLLSFSQGLPGFIKYEESHKYHIANIVKKVLNNE
ncbi:glycosyltransferase family 4 protein [Shewanella chilikensis]|uniref:Glycosyltransferase n=1 Tax=Shewanella chilikensis TaxID=558541 RepID=A0A6G7LQQ5_9GAMM|nr:glycosyltransferase family 4 protein [Shewanella chilikensis]QIJ04080.1 hypothetical protein GII14_07780 [Shewanella chilikensis]